MKKGKKLAAEASLDAAYFPVGEEARARFRHQSLLRDYEDLRKGTEAKKKKLQKANQKKLKLLAEVKFLRRRYKSLVQNRYGKLQFRLNKKPHGVSSSQLLITGQPCNESFQLPSKFQNQKVRDDVATSSTSQLIDLNRAFELIVEDMDEYHVRLEFAEAGKSTKSSVKGGAMANDLKLSICRDVGENSNQVVKRKITWQDQVALRV